MDTLLSAASPLDMPARHAASFASKSITIGDVAGATRADRYKYWTRAVRGLFWVQFSGEAVGFDARDSNSENVANP